MKLDPKSKLIRGLFGKNIKQAPVRSGYGDGLLLLGNTNKKVVALCADLAESTYTEPFANAHPGRFIEVGVAEQNLAGLAAGVAHAGYIPFMASYAVFSPGRNWDQIRVSICYSNANVKLVGSHAGISVGPDGATHQALEDIAMMRVLPNMTVIVPADALEANKATIASAQHAGPVYLRLGRAATPLFTTHKTPFVIGRANVLTVGKDVTIAACGPLVYEALAAARTLERKHKISAEVINSHTIKPLDERTIVRSVKKTGAVVTVEEHQVHGGLGGAVAEALSYFYPVPIRFVGMPDLFGESGTPSELLEKYGMSAHAIVESALDVVASKK